MAYTTDLPRTTWGSGYPAPHVVLGKIYKKMYYVYILKGENGKLYTGRTSNLKQRIKQHRQEKVWTTKRMGDIELVFYEAFKDKNDAIRREKYLKTSKGKSSLRQIIRSSIN